MENAREFYDELSPQYTEAIRRCVPRYEEMLGMLFRYLPAVFAPRRVLELGCGTGNLTAMIASRASTFPRSSCLNPRALGMAGTRRVCGRGLRLALRAVGHRPCGEVKGEVNAARKADARVRMPQSRN